MVRIKLDHPIKISTVRGRDGLLRTVEFGAPGALAVEHMRARRGPSGFSRAATVEVAAALSGLPAETISRLAAVDLLALRAAIEALHRKLPKKKAEPVE